MHVIGLDIGGANLKAASTENESHSLAFPIWREPEKLEEKLRELVAGFKTPACYAVTMTAELADCFQTKKEGVHFILNAVEKMADGIPVKIWQTGAEFVSPEVSREIPLMVAASNWHALSTWVGRLVESGNSLMIDIGSTTTDIIPLVNGVPVPNGLTDPERVSTGELVYTGIRRTPLCSLEKEMKLGDRNFRLAAELFATTYDVYLLQEKIEENWDCFETANGKPATIHHAYDRMTRMFCADRTEFTLEEMRTAAKRFKQSQVSLIEAAISQVIEVQGFQQVDNVIASGEGEFLVDEIVRQHSLLQNSSYAKFSKMVSEDSSQSACAFAVARLASERVFI